MNLRDYPAVQETAALLRQSAQELQEQVEALRAQERALQHTIRQKGPRTQEQAILDVMTDLPSPCTPSQVLAALQEEFPRLKRGNCAALLSRLAKQKKIRRISRGRYRLVKPKPASPPTVKPWPPIPHGTPVRTTKDAGSNDWASEAVTKRRWGVQGVVLNHHDSHGLCYDVRHEDGTIAS